METETKGVFPTGANIDYRTDDQKAKDWRPEEAFAPSPVEWREKTIAEIEAEIKASSISQGWTSRCVSEYAGIALEWAEFLEKGDRIVFSRRDVYCRRNNRPQGGMSMPDLFNIMKEGACLESDLPSTATQESVINQPYSVTEFMKETRAKYSSGAFFMWNKFTIEDLAQRIEAGTPVCLFWYFNNQNHDEWWNGEPKVVYNVDLFGADTGRHQASGVSYALHNGKKCIVVMDSAGQGTGLGTQKNLRFVSEDFIKARNYGAGFTIDKANLDHAPNPSFKYDFPRNLKFGDTGLDVQALQNVLVLEGCLAIKAPTMNYLGMTQAGVKKLQEKYFNEILKPLGLKQGTGNFADSTRKFVNAKYGTHN